LVCRAERGEASASVCSRTNDCRFFVSLEMTGPDGFEPMASSGRSNRPGRFEHQAKKWRESYMWHRFPIVCLLIVLPGWAKLTAQQAAPSEELLRLDRAFARATLDHGLDGWMSHLSDTVVVSLSEPMEPIGGWRNVHKHFSTLFAIPGFTMRWRPGEAHVFSSGKTGYSAGTYQFVIPNPLCKCVNDERGTYVIVWRRSETGEWKVKAFVPSVESGTGCGCAL